MRKTTNYGLALYDAEDKMSITASENSLNANMELIDSTLKEKATIEDMTTYIDEHKDELRGSSGVYVGSGEMPENCNIKIDPTGDVDIELAEGVMF